MPVLALAAPLQISDKFFVALMMLVLFGVLLRINLGSLSRQSIVLAVGASLLTVLVLEAVLPTHCGGIHELGWLAGLVGVLCGAICLRPVQTVSSRPRRWRTISLLILACITGPLVGLILAQLKIVLADVSPLDRENEYWVFTSVGAIAGVIAAATIAIARLSSAHKA